MTGCHGPIYGMNCLPLKLSFLVGGAIMFDSSWVFGNLLHGLGWIDINAQIMYNFFIHLI